MLSFCLLSLHIVLCIIERHPLFSGFSNFDLSESELFGDSDKSKKFMIYVFLFRINVD